MCARVRLVKGDKVISAWEIGNVLEVIGCFAWHETGPIKQVCRGYHRYCMLKID